MRDVIQPSGAMANIENCHVVHLGSLVDQKISPAISDELIHQLFLSFGSPPTHSNPSLSPPSLLGPALPPGRAAHHGDAEAAQEGAVVHLLTECGRGSGSQLVWLFQGTPGPQGPGGTPNRGNGLEKTGLDGI